MARKRTEPDKCPDGFVKFSKPVSQVVELRGWALHFEKLGIKTVIIRTSYNHFVLCRETSKHQVNGT